MAGKKFRTLILGGTISEKAIPVEKGAGKVQVLDLEVMEGQKETIQIKFNVWASLREGDLGFSELMEPGDVLNFQEKYLKGDSGKAKIY